VKTSSAAETGTMQTASISKIADAVIAPSLIAFPLLCISISSFP
jgi:hypothetical protein